MMTIRVGILTVSDRSFRKEREDLSGPAIGELVLQHGWKVEKTVVVPDDIEMIKGVLKDWSDNLSLDLILTTGGTGFAPRDITPEATKAVIDKEAPGLSEAMRNASMQVTPHAMLSRSISGIRGQSLIINLPGSPKGASENLKTVAPVLAHAIDLIKENPESEKGHTRL